MVESYLLDVLVLLAVAVIMVALVRSVRLPPVIAYLIVGTVIGPNALGWLSDAAEIQFMAELGVMILMFVLGLEFSLPVLMNAKHLVFGYGGFQVVVTTAVVGTVAYLAGLSPAAAIAVGGAVAMSSTAVLVKQLSEQGDLQTRHGRMVIGVLLFQDLATLPFLVAVPVLATGGESMAGQLTLALLISAGTFVAMVLVGRWFASGLLRRVAATRSMELFLLTALLLMLGAAAVAELVGLPQPLGAFMAGMVIGETPFRHQVESDIRPFQDVLLGLFFITIGMQLDPPVLLATWNQVLLFVAAIVIAKGLIFTGIGFVGPAQKGVVLRAALCLAHVGEFGLLLTALSMSTGLLSPATGQVLLAAMVLSMMIAPLFVHWNYLVLHTTNLFGYREDLARQDASVERALAELDNHVILCGYGRVGQNLARFLEVEGVPFAALDLDAERVQQAQAAGDAVLYGDAGRYSMLQAAGLGRAKALAVTFRDVNMALKVIRQARQHYEDIPILVRATNMADLEELEETGATDIIPEPLEASVVMGAQLLLLVGIPSSRVETHSASIRADQYRPLRGFFRGQAKEDGSYTEQLRALHLLAGAYAVGRSLSEFEFANHGVELLAVRRGGIRVPQPTLDTSFRAGDTLVLYGRPDRLAEAERRLLTGP